MEKIIGYSSQPLNDSRGEFAESFVGYLDILGFKEKVRDEEKRHLLVKNYDQIYNYLNSTNPIDIPSIPIGPLHGFHEDVGKSFFKNISIPRWHIYNISDSIFIIIVPDKKGELCWITYAIALFIIMVDIQLICMKNDLPTRGAISSGEIFYDSNKGIFIGEPITQAYLWERVQKFAWLSIDPFCGISKKYFSFPKTIGANLLREIYVDDNFFNSKRIKSYYEYLKLDYVKELKALVPIGISTNINDSIVCLNELSRGNIDYEEYYKNAISIIKQK